MAGLLDRVGTRLDVRIRVGVDTGVLRFTVKGPAGAVYDMSGWSWAGGAYAVADRTQFTPWVFDTTQAAVGIIDFSISHAALAVIASVGEAEEAAYCHWVNAIDPGGQIIPVLYGDFRAIWGSGA